MCGAFVEQIWNKLRVAGKRQRLIVSAAVAFLLASLSSGGVAWAQAGTTAVPAPSNWAHIAGIIDSPWMTVVLLVAGCALLFHDLLTPLTWGATGTIGVLFIGLVFASHVTGHTGGWIGVLLLLVGLALLLLEIHVVPGSGMTGMGGMLLLFLGMFWSLGGTRNVVFALSVSSVLAVVALLAFFAYLPKSPVWKQLGQQMRHQANQGQTPGAGATIGAIGQQGIVISPLRPYGMAEIAGVRQEVVTEGDFLTEGTPIIISGIEGDRIIVERVPVPAAVA